MKSRDPLKIAISGVTVSGNMGGAAMLRATMGEIEKRHPGSEYSLLSYMPAADRRMPKLAQLSIVSADYRLLVLAYLPLAFLLYPFLHFRGVRKLLRIIPYFRALDDADVVIDLCGIAFSDGRGLPLLAYNVACVLPALAMRRPVAKLSQALGPFRDPLNRFLAGQVLSRAAVVIARGEQSFVNLKDLGISNCTSRPDVTFALEVDETARRRARQMLAQEGVGLSPIIVSPSEVVRRLCEERGIDFEAEMLDFLERVRGSGRSIVILPHSLAVDGSKNNDLELCRRLFEALKSGGQIALIDTCDDPVALRAIIGEAWVHISCRFHAVVGALAMGVPTLIIGWSHKYAEMSKPLQSERWAIDWRRFSAQEAFALYRALSAERETVAEQIRSSLPAIKDGAEDNFRLALSAAAERA